MAAPENFVALILTHGRADHVVTYAKLRRFGYTGPIRLVVDDEDDQYYEYCRRYPGEVVQFHKAGVKCDTYDNRKERRVILFARNAAFDIAKELGYRYFIELDDDYSAYSFRYNDGVHLRSKITERLDEVFCAMLEFMQDVPQASTIAMAQDGDFIGGRDSGRGEKVTLWRKAMNTFVCDTERRFEFVGRINEDVNTYTTLGSRGVLFFTINMISMHQNLTQQNAGGMTGAYLDGGTYIKSFYSVISMPSAVKVCAMGWKNFRLHHEVDWRRCVPVIMPEKYRKT